MGYYLLIAAGLVGPFVLIRYRETVGDSLGEAEWMRKVGGVHNVVVIAALFIFFWTLAELTGTTGVLFAPLKFLAPGFQQETVPAF
jgi:uncharacterized membrane protein YdfJ with MMPL/SSD domain